MRTLDQQEMQQVAGGFFFCLPKITLPKLSFCLPKITLPKCEPVKPPVCEPKPPVCQPKPKTC
jgi:hypothetical protein